MGTDDTGASDADPTGGGAAGNNMVLVAEYQYDGGQCGGAGNLTQQTLHVDAETVRATAYGYDWRNRRTTVDGEEDFFQAVTYDNLNRPVTVGAYDTTASGNLVARTDTAFDDLGRVYQKLVYAVDPATGILGDALADNTWYDLAGNPVKRQPAGSQGFTKTFYDCAGRPTGTFLGYDPGETSWEQAGEVDDDTIVEQTETVFDAAGNAIFNTTLRRMETSAGTGPLQPPAASQPWGLRRLPGRLLRRHRPAAWPPPTTAPAAPSLLPARARLGAPFPRPAPRCWSPRQAYNARGERFSTTDPAGRVSQTQFDDAGRVVAQVQNVVTEESIVEGEFDRNVTGARQLHARRKARDAHRGQQRHRRPGHAVVYGTTLSDSFVAASISCGRNLSRFGQHGRPLGRRSQRRLQPRRVRLQRPGADRHQEGPKRHGPPVRLRRAGPPHPGLRDHRRDRHRHRRASIAAVLRGPRPAAELNQLR